MELTNFSQFGVAQKTSQSQTATATATSALTSDFETFLKLMTTQAQYQDPLEPMDSSDYTAQLAQFSSVEQQVQTNDTLSTIMSQLSLSTMTQLTGWVGKEVRAPAAARFDGENSVTVHPNPAAGSDRVQLVVYNEDNTEVQRLSLPLSSDPYEWDGRLEDSSVLPDGNYTFVVESYRNDEKLLTEVAEIYGQVKETQTIDGEVALILDSGSAILASSVTALREPKT
jgi:flagellar basal-body rod modification protein FlgD